LNAGLFITGTDTGVGKTTVGRALARLALRRARRPIPFKPVETGCAAGDPADARLLWEAAGRPVRLGEVCPHPLALPVAPAAAAAAAGIRLDLDLLARNARALALAGDLLLVEGAGGLLVPYAGAETCADLIARLGLPVLLVARTALGTINHTALTVSELRRRGLALAGLVLVRTAAAPGPQEASNADLIAAVSGVHALGTLPYLAGDALADPDRLADELAAALGPAAIERLLG
jgi:dethiobiotin synthetase